MLVRYVVMHVAAQPVPLRVFMGGVLAMYLGVIARNLRRLFKTRVSTFLPGFTDELQKRQRQRRTALFRIDGQRHDVREVFALSLVHKSPSSFQPFEEGFVIIGAITWSAYNSFCD